MKHFLPVLLTLTGVALGQQDGWRPVDDPETAAPAEAAPAPNETFPSQLTIRPGTYITVRLNELLSSDGNYPGDAFSATLVQPVVVDGLVVAQRGQTVGGRVVEAEKAGRRRGVSRLGVQLTDLTLVDGQQLAIHSQLIRQMAPGDRGRDAGMVVGGTAVGAAIGAAADGGAGAGIGALAGAAAGAVGVLLTRGRPTELYPETVLTFRLEAPVTLSTERAPQAFRYVTREDYQNGERARRPMLRPRPAYAYYAPYPYYWSPYYYGPGFYFRFHRHRW